MEITRRKVLQALGLGFGAVAVGGIGAAASLYLNNTKNRSPPIIQSANGENLVLCDLHCHPSINRTLEDKMEMLGSPGLVGLTERSGPAGILTYHDAVQELHSHPDFKELTPGKMAKFKEGYFVRTAEVHGGFLDFIAIDFDGEESFSNQDSPLTVIQDIRERNGLVVLSTPYSVKDGVGFRVANAEEEPIITETCRLSDFVEVHDSYNIDLLWYGLKESNRAATKLQQSGCGANDPVLPFASSDGHRELGHCKLTGLYVAEDNLKNAGTFRSALESGDYYLAGNAKDGPYTSRGEFVRSMILPKLLPFLK